MSARKPELEWDPRPLPAGWSPGYDEENQRCCYFRHDTTPPSISFIHPLDIGLDSSNSQVSPTLSSRSVSRPLPKPPGSLPSYELPLSRVSSKKTPPPSYANPALPPPSPIIIASSPSSKAVFPTPPLKPQSQSPATMRNPPAKLSAAQQLYASSLANHGLSGPSLSSPPSVIETRPNGPDRPSLYKYPVAAYASPALPSALRSRSPASTISSRSSAMSPRLMASPSFVYGSEPQSPPYSEFSLPDDEPRELSPGSSSRARLSSTPHTRGHSESDGYLRPVIPPTMQENAARVTHATTYNTSDQTRSLFPLRYVDVNGGQVPEVRNVSTIAKPPPGSRTGASVANQVGTITSNPFPSQLTTTSDTPRPAAPFVVGAPVHGQAPAVSTTHLTMPSAQPAVAAQFTGPISPPPPSVQVPATPPPPPANLQTQQQIPVAPVRPSHNHSYPNSPLQPQFSPPPPPTIQQQHTPAVPIRPPQNPPKPMSPPQSLPGPPRPNTNTTTNGATRPPKPPRPNAKPSGFMSSLGSSLASSLGKTAVSFGTQALLSGLGIEEEGEEEGGGIADALVSGFSSLTAGGDEGGGEPPPAPVPGAGEYTTVYDPGAYATPEAAPVPPEAAAAPPVAPPPQPVSAVPMTGGEYQAAYSAGFQYTSYSVELPSIEFNYSSGSSGGGNNANNPNSNYSGKPWNTTTNQQNVVNTGGNMYSGQPGLPSGAQQPFQSHQSLRPVYHHPQSKSWNPYQYQ